MSRITHLADVAWEITLTVENLWRIKIVSAASQCLAGERDSLGLRFVAFTSAWGSFYD